MSKATNTLFLCSRGRRLRFARSSEAALLQPSSRRLSFSARRRRSGEGSAPDPPRPRRGRAAGGRAGRSGAARAPTERARAAGSSGSPGSRRAPRTPDWCPPSPTAARTGVLGARSRRSRSRSAGHREEPRGSGRTDRWSSTAAPAMLAQLTFEARELKSGNA